MDGTIYDRAEDCERAEEYSRAITTIRAVLRTGRSAVLTIVGGAGTGKTSLLHAVAGQAVQMDLAVGAASARTADLAVGGLPLLLALRSGPRPILDEEGFAELASSPSAPLVLLDRLRTRLDDAARRSPLLIAIDDVDAADSFSRFAVRVLAGHLAEQPVVWAFSSTDPVDRVVGELPLPGVAGPTSVSVALGPLSGSAVAAMARERLGRRPDEQTARMLEGVAGNPRLTRLILDGVARSGDSSGMPAEFTLEVRQALRRLEPAVRELVRTVAVLDRPVGVDLVGELLPAAGAAASALLASDLLEAADRAGFLSDDGRRVTFRHRLVRDVVASELSDRDRRVRNRRCAEVLLAHGCALDAGDHALAAAPAGDDEMLALLDRAIDEARMQRPQTAARLAVDVFDLLPPGHPEWFAAGERCLDLLAGVEQGRDVLRIAGGAIAQTDDPLRRSRLHALAARAHWLAGDVPAGVARIEEKATGGTRSGTASDALTAAVRALLLAPGEPPDELRATALHSLDAARRAGDGIAVSVAVHALGEIERRCDWHAASLERFRELHRLTGPAQAAPVVTALQRLDRHADAHAVLAAADEAVREIPSLAVAALWQAFDLGHLDEAEAAADALLVRSDQLGCGASGTEAELVRTAVALIRGDLRSARASIAKQVRGRPAEAPPVVAVLRGWLAAAEGLVKESSRMLSPVVSDHGTAHTLGPWGPMAVRLAARVGNAACDSRLAEHALAVAEESAARNPGVPTDEGTVWLLRGLLRADVALVERAVDRLKDSPRPYVRAVALEDHGRILLARGDRAEAVSRLTDAADLYRRIGAEPRRESVQRALRSAGVRGAPPGGEPGAPATGWAALTPAEVRVARLIGDGHTNRMAARRLGVSINTINTQVRAVFTKLGVQSRVQLANAVRERPWEPG